MIKFLIFLLLGMLMGGNPVYAVVRRYQDTTIYSGASTLPEWAYYDYRARNSGNLSFLNSQDDAVRLDPLDICIPFFQSREPLPMYLSNNGYIAPFPFSNCPAYCPNQIFFNQAQRTGAQSPLIGFYVTDLDLSPGTGGGTMKKWRGRKTLSDGVEMEVAMVDLEGVRRHQDGSGSLNAAVELWANGTIIFRYISATSAVFTNTAERPGTGLLWTEKQRVISPDVGTANANILPTNIVAIRYDPVPDPCAVNVGCSACAAADGCVWCGPTSECVGSDIVDDVCSVTSRNECVPPNLNTSADIPQVFYKVSMDYNSAFQSIENYVNTSDVTISRVTQLGMSFPYFSFQPNETKRYYNVTIAPDYTISVTSSSLGCLSATSAGTCAGSDYSYSIVLFSGALAQTAVSTFGTLRLSQRPVGAFMCEKNITADGCPPTFVYQFSDLTTAPTESLDNTVRVTAQAALYEDGTITLSYKSFLRNESCASSGAWFRFGAVASGIFRNGNNFKDPSSVLLPWTQISAGLKFTATPVPGCLDCGGKGYCGPERKCICKANYAGDQCEACAPNHYGPQCTPCQGCLNGGVCDDGVTGTGYCTNCTTPFSGANCSVRCQNGVNNNCPNGCGMGYCECGKCVCLFAAGFYGDRCERWADPCRRYSLLGCSECVDASTELVACEWCTSSTTCRASPQQSWTNPRASNACDIPQIDAAQCKAPYARTSEDSQFAVITLIVVFACLALCFCLTLCTVCLCRNRPRNPLVLGAVPGVADFGFPRREREIIGISRLPIQGRGGRPVQGIPLKQIPMRDLVLMQRKKRHQQANAVNPIVDLAGH